MKLYILFVFTLLFVAVKSQSTCPAKYLNTNGFLKIGTYNGYNGCTPYAKTYYLSTLNKLKWYEAKQWCEINGMEFLTLETQEESDRFMQMFNLNPTVITDWVYIGGITILPKSRDHWYWIDLGKPLSFQPIFAPGQPTGTHVSGATEYCLSVGKVSGQSYYNDIRCDGLAYNFLCQTRGA